MEPYRRLYVVNERGHDPPTHELRGLAVLLVVLGVLRILPALASGEAANSESVIATAMLAIGTTIVLRVPRRWRLLRRRVRHAILHVWHSRARRRTSASDRPDHAQAPS